MQPVAKFFGALALVFAAAVLPVAYAPLMLGMLVLVALLSKVPLLEFAVACFGLVLFISLFSFYAFGGLERAGLTAAHAASMMMPFYIFSRTTAPHEMMEGMRKAGVPRDFSFVFSTALPFSKTVRRKADSVRIAQQSRCGKSVWAFTVPVFNSIFEKARGLAISIESRGGLGKEN
ncbi:MAG: energy-coupling factor transporter transmembrane component T [Candidatus ainarchaeum sp.]|nr:energy-coupling factor transporter transmembrane component T [Candidatus ainarchaeum sp.]MDD5096675.1 energy-coupling factor transporter transmembrane component T [Candidatus ainarchaeum sp.]